MTTDKTVCSNVTCNNSMHKWPWKKNNLKTLKAFSWPLAPHKPLSNPHKRLPAPAPPGSMAQSCSGSDRRLSHSGTSIKPNRNLVLFSMGGSYNASTQYRSYSGENYIRKCNLDENNMAEKGMLEGFVNCWYDTGREPDREKGWGALFGSVSGLERNYNRKRSFENWITLRFREAV